MTMMAQTNDDDVHTDDDGNSVCDDDGVGLYEHMGTESKPALEMKAVTRRVQD